MVLTVPVNTYNALQNAHLNGIVPRDFVWIRALNTVTEGFEHIGLWSGNVPVTVNVIRPDNGATESRTYQGAHGLMTVPAIPRSMKLEVRSINLEFSNLSPEIINAVLAYSIRGQVVQIHRGLLDPATMNLVDPAHCRLDGLVAKAPMKRAKAGNDGRIIIVCQPHTRTLSKGNPQKLSDEFYKRRGGRMPYLDVEPKITWGQEDIIHEKKRPKRSKWID
jgi:hypothetical protein